MIRDTVLRCVQPFPSFRQRINAARRKWGEFRTIRRWEKAGRPAPMPAAAKRAFLRAAAAEHGLIAFVETGTFVGDTLEAMRGAFSELHSIELSDDYYARALKRFADMPSITLWQGDSGDVLPIVLQKVRSPTLFWLDGHHSGADTAHGEQATPIRRELQHIAGHPLMGKHLVVVDDARLFGKVESYPGLDEMRAMSEKLGFRTFSKFDDLLVLK